MEWGQRHPFRLVHSQAAMPPPSLKTTFVARLRQLRVAKGMTQTELGKRLDLEEDVASARMNRYERGVHLPDLETAERIAQELGVPLAYLVTTDDRLAELILRLASLSKKQQEHILSLLPPLPAEKD